MVDEIRIGADGFALVVAADGTLIAHGDPDQKALVAQSARSEPRAASAAGSGAGLAPVRGLRRPRQMLAVAAPHPPLGWTVIVEQPTREAYATAARLQRQLVVAIGAGAARHDRGRPGLRPPVHRADLRAAARHAGASRRATSKRASHIDTGDEFGDLGEAFNTMADRLVELQEDVKKQERQAMFGRIAAGLVHDLSHPIQNIGNSTRLLLRDDLDQESRETFHRTIDRELETLKRFMDDLRNIVKPKPVERFPMDVNRLGRRDRRVDERRGRAHGVALEARYAAGAADHRRRPLRARPRATAT